MPGVWVWRITEGFVWNTNIPLPPSLQPQFPIFSAKIPTYHQYHQTVKQYVLQIASQNMKQLFLSTNNSAWNWADWGGKKVQANLLKQKLPSLSYSKTKQMHSCNTTLAWPCAKPNILRYVNQMILCSWRWYSHYCCVFCIIEYCMWTENQTRFMFMFF